MAAKNPADFERLVQNALPADAAHGPVLVGVSGGADSVALLLALARSADSATLPIAAHLNHRLRGQDSDGDETWVCELCHRHGVTLVTDRIDVAAERERSATTLEEAARNARQRFLARAAGEQGCRFVAVAHTADDQAETILHHIVRGTGLSGLCGMPSRRTLADGIELIRPLLAVPRAEIESYLQFTGQDYRIDESNADAKFTRNRIRHSLLPLLKEEFNPRIREALLRLSQSAGEADATLRTIAGALLDTALLECSETVCRLRCEPLQSQPRHLVRTAFVELWKRCDWPRQAMGFAEWDRLADLVETGGAITLPARIDARRRGALLVLTADAERQ